MVLIMVDATSNKHDEILAVLESKWKRIDLPERTIQFFAVVSQTQELHCQNQHVEAHKREDRIKKATKERRQD